MRKKMESKTLRNETNEVLFADNLDVDDDRGMKMMFWLPY